MLPRVRRFWLLSMLALTVAPGLQAQTSSGDEAVACAQHLQAIGRALAAYQRDRGDLPPHLSDLYPDYLADARLFHCPADRSSGSPGLQGIAEDPMLPTSYIYEMSLEKNAMGFLLGPIPGRQALTWRGLKMAQRVQFGSRVPVVRCWHHLMGSGTRSEPFVLSLTPKGQVYRSESFWEFDPETVPAVLARMEQDLSAGPDQFRRRWRPQAMAWYFFSFAGRVPEETSNRMRTAAARLAALTRAGGSGDVWSAVGSLYYAGGDSAKAISAYETGARVSGSHQATACLLLADLYRQEDQPDKAEALLNRLPSLDSTDAYYIAIVASAYQSAGEPNRAAEWQRVANMAARSRRADAPFSSSYRLLILVFALWLLAVIVVALAGAVYFAARRLAG